MQNCALKKTQGNVCFDKPNQNGQQNRIRPNFSVNLFRQWTTAAGDDNVQDISITNLHRNRHRSNKIQQ